MEETPGGFVYVLTNEAMPGFVKIGFTQQAAVAERLRQLEIKEQDDMTTIRLGWGKR